MKAFFLVGLLALVASAAFAQYGEVVGSYEGGAGGGGAQQCPLGTKLDSCRNYLLDRCTTMKDFPVTWRWWTWWKGGCEELLHDCCSQLGQMPPQCRCNIIQGSIQRDLGGVFGFQRDRTVKVIQAAKNLPPRCNQGPACNVPSTTTGYYW
uniref:Hordoindoline-a n=1 Tax=Hordeum vulgare subsp. spontaneum TaxID=77009 RepID=D5KQR8_HORVS|nr:hordoindoline-a [Hordeum vulgare subsp. spontaneum]